MWQASIVLAMQWKELNVNAQMATTMGTTQWIVRKGVLRGKIHLTSALERDISVLFKLHNSELTASGGAISGHVALSELSIKAAHKKSVAVRELKRVEGRGCRNRR